LKTKRLVMVALGAIVLPLVLVACGGGDDDDDGVMVPQPGADGEAASLESKPPTFAADEDKAVRESAGGVPADDPGSGEPPLSSASLERKIIFHATLEMQAENVQGTFNEVGRIARVAGGFIEQSSLFTQKDDEGEEQPYATLSLRIPSTQYQDVLADLRGLTGVEIKREESGANEVTEQYTDLQSRLRNLERSESQYLALLERANSIQDILTVQERIDGVRLQIERIQGQLKVLDDLVDLATVNVSLQPIPPAKAEESKTGPQSPSEAFADAWDWSTDVARYLLAFGAGLAAVAIWLAIPAAVVLLAGRYGRRRKPEPAA